jgi:glycosyltransferase involved in cell wall biosynthesis
LTTRIAIIDPGSFVLPYDYQLVRALSEHGHDVDFYGSLTRYNQQFLDAMRRVPSVSVRARAISSSVASPLWSALAFVALMFALLRNARRYDLVNLQFSGFWPVELAVFFALRRKFVFTIHNAAPHGSTQSQHRPTRWLASVAHSLVFVSVATREEFMRRYGERFRAKSSVLALGLLPVAPYLDAVPYQAGPRSSALAFWGTVKPYKGVDLFVELARSDEVARRGLALEIHGAWASELRGLRDELSALGVSIEDSYLDGAQLLLLFARSPVFLLPYHEASQSGALYSLLNHGCIFICSDVGDLGAFMRQYGLEGLILRERTAGAVIECLDYFAANAQAVIQALGNAQRLLGWAGLLAKSGRAYRVSDATIPADRPTTP